MASSEAKEKTLRPKFTPLNKKKKPTDKNLVESESEEVEMKEVNDPVSRPSPNSQVTGRNITDPASKEEKRESENLENNGYSYGSAHKGPFVVYIDKIGENNVENRPRRVPINPLKLNAVLLKLKIKYIISVNKIGYGRCKAECKSATAANSILSSNLKSNGYEPNIVKHFIFKMGIIFNIPTKFSDSELKEYIFSPVPIQEIIRVKTKD